MDQSLPLDAEDIGRRVLRLAANVHGPDDLAPARIEQFTGIPVAFDRDNADVYGFNGRLTDVWDYNLVSLPRRGGRPSRLMFSFDDNSRACADMAPICALDLDAYAAALAAAGYRATPVRGPHDEVLHWDFARDGVHVHIHVRGENDARADHACVSKLIIHA